MEFEVPADLTLSSLKEIKDVLASLEFAPSCVDMAWRWQVQKVYVTDGDEGIPVWDGYRLRTTFRRPDRITGKFERGYGRWWEVPRDITVSGAVKTAYAACKMILEHELMESFKWNGIRVFDPHNSIQKLAQISTRT